MRVIAPVAGNFGFCHLLRSCQVDDVELRELDRTTGPNANSQKEDGVTPRRFLVHCCFGGFSGCQTVVVYSQRIGRACNRDLCEIQSKQF